MNIPIVNDWKCSGSADCCRSTTGVLMTDQEFAEILRVTLKTALRVSHPRPGWTLLEAAPCPLLVGDQCSVYKVRPYQCRRFECHRAPGEAFDPSGPLGCKNLSDRLTQDRGTRRAYALNQRKAMKWALTHGWTGRET